MGIDVLNPILSPDPVGLPAWEEEESEQLQEVNQVNLNLGLLLANLQTGVEIAKNGNIHAKLDGVENIHRNLKKINQFLDAVDAHLSNKDNRNFDVAGNQQLMNELFELFPHDLLKKDSLNRDELEVLSKTFARRSEHLSRSIPMEMMMVQRAMEERHDMIKALKDLITAWIRHGDHIINQPR